MQFTDILSTIIFAQEGAGQQGGAGIQGMIAQFFPFIILFVVLYLIIIRPERRRAKEHRDLIQKLKAGDQVVTNGGLHGKITHVEQATITIQVAEGVELEIERNSVARLQQSDSGSEDEDTSENKQQ